MIVWTRYPRGPWERYENLRDYFAEANPDWDTSQASFYALWHIDPKLANNVLPVKFPAPELLAQIEKTIHACWNKDTP